VDEIVRGLHARGKPTTLSVACFGKGCATASGGFGLSTIGQSVQ
jgi:hypothetical protein